MMGLDQEPIPLGSRLWCSFCCLEPCFNVLRSIPFILGDG